MTKRKSVHKKKQPLPWWAWLGGVAIVGLLGYGIWSALPSSSATTGDIGGHSLEAVDPFPAPAVRFEDIRNTTYTLSDFYDRPTIITFIALWCGVCEDEIAELEKFETLHPKEFNYIFVDVDPVQDTRIQLRQFAEEHPRDNFYFVFDETNAIVNAFLVDALQTTFVINTNGDIVYHDMAVTELADFEKMAEEI